jgi:hypothetical protein
MTIPDTKKTVWPQGKRSDRLINDGERTKNKDRYIPLLSSPKW